MNGFRKLHVVLAAAGSLVLMLVFQAGAVAPGPKVSQDKNKHNLSSAVFFDTVPQPIPAYRADTPLRSSRDSSIIYKANYDSVANPKGLQICIFCHTPHSSNSTEQTPLWNRKFSTQTFSRYSSPTLQIRVNPAISNSTAANYGSDWKPDGASKLCLSCHDGSTAPGTGLGDVLQGGLITMDATKDSVSAGKYITTIASFNSSTNKMKTGHHPVSFVYNGSVQQAISSARLTGGFKLPTAVPEVKLDKNKKMQCTTCHDPHQNQSDDTACYDTGNGNALATCGTPVTATRKVVPFWVLHSGSNTASDDHDKVCTSCHAMTSKPSWP